MMIPGELEHLESLVKVARKKKDTEAAGNQISMVRRICINKTHKSKTLHLSVEVNSCLVEGLVDTRASVSVMAATVVRELGLMHLVSGSKTYKTTSRAVTQAFGRIEEVLIKVRGVQCTMTFMVVDMDSYDVLLGLDLLIKIGAIVDVEQGLIQVRRGPGSDVEVLPLTMVNMLQKLNLETVIPANADALKHTPRNLDALFIKSSLHDEYGANVQIDTRELDSDSDSNESYDQVVQVVEPVEGAPEFGNTKLEELILSEGPQQILQLTLQEQANDLMKEEITDADDYANWIQWVADAERGEQVLSGTGKGAEVPVLLQVQREDIANSHNSIKAQLDHNREADSRWDEIHQKMRMDQVLNKEMGRQLWRVLEQYQYVFAWNKGELGCCTIREHSIDTQGFPPCRVAPGRLSYWEEAEVKRQINVLVELGKMRASDSAYACRVTLPIKKDGSRRFCGDYRPLNLQTRRDSFPMLLVDDVISQLGRSAWFTALDLQSGFWQIRMAPEDRGKIALITKSELYDWTVMPFGLKNATSTFTWTMSEVFKDLGDRFLKVFVDDLNIHSESWEDHLQHLEVVLSRLKEVNLKLNPNKCCFAAESIVFLGHVVNKEGTKPDPSKIDAMLRF